MNPRYLDKKSPAILKTSLIAMMALVFGTSSLLTVDQVNAGDTVRLGISRSLLSAPLIIAFDQGYFKKEGTDVTIKEYNSGRLALEGLLAGEVDVSTVAGTPIMFNSFKRQDFCILGTFVYSYHDTKMIARKDKGISKASDLRGKRIGVNKGTTGQFFLSTFLVYNSLLASEVQITDIGNKDLPEALKSELVDAIAIWEPHAYKAMKLLQDKAVKLPSSDIYRTTFNLVTMKDFLKPHLEAIKKVLRAIDRATIFIEEQKETSKAIVAKRLGKKKRAISALWDEYVYELFLDQALPLTLADEARWALKHNLTKKTKVPNFMNCICLDALEAVKPDAVTIIH